MNETRTWTPSTFEIALGDLGPTRAKDTFTHMSTVTGETWGSFGINVDQGPWGTDWIVTHLPTGYRLATTESKSSARRFCVEIADLTDWSAVTPGSLTPDVKARAIEAYHRARGAMFTPLPVAAAAPGGGT